MKAPLDLKRDLPMVIQYNAFKLIKNLVSLLCLTFILSCTDNSRFKDYEKGIIELPSGEKLTTYLALNTEEQTKGLSGIKNDEFAEDEAMLFFNLEDSMKHFWMPETYFDLDIIFLNKDLYVLDIDRNVKHFEKSGPDELIPRARPVFARHVLEVRADSKFAKKIHQGMMLKWLSEPSLLQIESKIRSPQ